MSSHDDDQSEVRQIIEEAIRPHLTQRWLTPKQLRQAAEVWVKGRNDISESSRKLVEEYGIPVSSKWEYVNPDHLNVAADRKLTHLRA
jgi:hypothetical protein